MGRVFKFVAAFIVTAVVVFGSILAFNWKPFSIFFENREAMVEGSEWVEQTYSLRGLADYIGQNPEYVSVTSRVLSQPDSTISFQGGVRRPMGTTANLFILIAAADKVEKGELDLNFLIPWEDITRYQLPGVNASEHDQSYRAANNRGWINADNQITLQNALKLLPEFNDLALADYLWWTIDTEYWSELGNQPAFDQTDMPLPFSGLYITTSPGLRNMEAEDLFRQELELSIIDYRESVIERSRQFTSDPDYREEVKEFTRSNRLGNTFMEERDALALFPKTTSDQLVDLLSELWEETFISAAVSERVKEWMRWPMERQSGIQRDFSDYAAIYDNRMGLLNGIDFGTSSYTGDTTVQAIFFDRIQIAFWFHMSSNHMHQDFQQRLIFDPAMIQQMKRVVEAQNNEPSAGINPSEL